MTNLNTGRPVWVGKPIAILKNRLNVCYRAVGAWLALLYMAPNRFTGKIISLWGLRVLCSPTDAKQKRVSDFVKPKRRRLYCQMRMFSLTAFVGGSYFWAQRVSLYQTIPVAAQILAFGL